MADLSRDALQDLFDTRFPGGSRVVFQRTVYPFTVARLSAVPRVTVLADALLTFQLATTAPLLTVEDVEDVEGSLVLRPKGLNAAFTFQAPDPDEADDLALEREVNWTDERLAEARRWHEDWVGLDAEEAG